MKSFQKNKKSFCKFLRFLVKYIPCLNQPKPRTTAYRVFSYASVNTHRACGNTHRVYGNTIERGETSIKRGETSIERGETHIERGEAWGCTEALPKGGGWCGCGGGCFGVLGGWVGSIVNTNSVKSSAKRCSNRDSLTASRNDNGLTKFVRYIGRRSVKSLFL